LPGYLLDDTQLTGTHKYRVQWVSTAGLLTVLLWCSACTAAGRAKRARGACGAHERLEQR
jgi:hypothetical protein